MYILVLSSPVFSGLLDRYGMIMFSCDIPKDNSVIAVIRAKEYFLFLYFCLLICMVVSHLLG